MMFDLKTFGGLAIFGVLASAWSQVKILFSYLRSFILVTRVVRIDNRRTMFHICKKIRNTMWIPAIGNRRYGIQSICTIENGSQIVFGHNILCGNSLGFYRRLIPVMMRITMNDTLVVTMTHIRMLFNFEKFMENMLRESDEITREHVYCQWYVDNVWGSFSDNDRNRIKQESPTGKASAATSDSGGGDDVTDLRMYDYSDYYYGLSDIIYTPHPDKLGFIDFVKIDYNKRSITRFTTDEEKDLLKHVEYWLLNQNWYRDRNIPWKRGCVLYGPPGTGKSSMVWSVSRNLDIPIEVFHLESFSNQDMYKHWSRSESGKIILIEDFDNIFDKRENIAHKKRIETAGTPLTFDTFLNVIDGVMRIDGFFMIITTNFPEKIDSALASIRDGKVNISRPGRVDIAIECKHLNESAARHIAANILSELSEEEREEIVSAMKFPMTAASIQEHFINLAIQDKWKKFPSKMLKS